MILKQIEVSIDLTCIGMIVSGIKTLVNSKLRTREFQQYAVSVRLVADSKDYNVVFKNGAYFQPFLIII